MRSYLSGDSSSRQFADNLLQLGNGSFTSLDPDGAVSLKNIGRIINTEEEPLQVVFPNLILFKIMFGYAKELSLRLKIKRKCKLLKWKISMQRIGISGYVPVFSAETSTTFLLQFIYDVMVKYYSIKKTYERRSLK
ncbi:hypothetical protein TNCT_285951 [Trichonephila clavata]|uniref:Uncharacterized protein n=1 Tax=Trichonephila clavata TaxID=2740835 RepID=A0A8X6HZT1_TRICU|nr:hypothetical protein TNCT_285951 [Trichonephila clavata]